MYREINIAQFLGLPSRVLRLFSFGGYGLALAALALVVFGAYDSYPIQTSSTLKLSRLSEL